MSADMREALELIAAQDSGIVGSTKKADCMAAVARAALRHIPRPLTDKQISDIHNATPHTDRWVYDFARRIEQAAKGGQ